MYAELTLSGTCRDADRQVRSLLSISTRDSFVFTTFFRTCAAIRTDRRVRRVLVHVKPTFSSPMPAALEEIRRELERLSEAGKELVFYATDYRDAHLYLASACAQRVLHPLGALRCTGIARNSLFFKRLADRLGIRFQIVRRGKFKSAADRLRLETIDPANLEQYQRWIDHAASHLHDTIAGGYARPRADLDAMLCGRSLDASEALEQGWIDEASTIESLRDRWKNEKVRPRTVKTRRSLGRGKRVAVLSFEGAIVEGRSRMNPLLGQTMGSETFVKQVDSLRRRRRVRAVVLRVNSGGGSAVASEDIRSALVRLAGDKPLLVSMSAVAGSGGYWISMTGSPVYACATTLTGSIGVINIAVDAGTALADQGITHSVVKTHEHADAGTGLRPLSPQELEDLDRQVGSVYERFLRLVADNRSIGVGEVHERAQGRVWAGEDAVEQRLVDRTGGLADAVEEARKAAGLRRARVVFLPHTKRSLLERLVSREGRPVEMEESLRLQSIVGCARSLLRIANRPLVIEPAALAIPHLLDAGGLDLFDADVQVE